MRIVSSRFRFHQISSWLLNLLSWILGVMAILSLLQLNSTWLIETVPVWLERMHLLSPVTSAGILTAFLGLNLTLKSFQQSHKPKSKNTIMHSLKILFWFVVLMMPVGVALSFNLFSSSEEELTLFNSKGKAVAYVVLDDELTIYLWTGEPVAYLVSKGESFSIYGFKVNIWNGLLMESLGITMEMQLDFKKVLLMFKLNTSRISRTNNISLINLIKNTSHTCPIFQIVFPLPLCGFF